MNEATTRRPFPARSVGRRSFAWRRHAASRLLGAVLLAAPFAAFAGVPSAAAASAPGTWQATGPMLVDRVFHAAVRLSDGSVIVAGGQDLYSWTAAADRWSPATGTWTAAGVLPQAASGQVAVRLADGRALFAGGNDGTAYYSGSDIFSAATGKWTAAGSMTHAHSFAAAGTVAGGDVVVVGGYDGSAAAAATTAVDRYAVASGTWSAAAPLPGPGRFSMTATSLANGKLLVAGGDTGVATSTSTVATVQIYDPAANTWTAGESMKQPRFDHAAVLLKDGRVLVAGGSDSQGRALNTTEVYDPSTGHWTSAGILNDARIGLTLTLLADGRVLAVGGFESSTVTALSTTEIYDPTTGGWSLSGRLAAGRRYQTATLLADNRVLVAGGYGATAGTALTSAEVYTPPAAPATYPGTTFHGVAPTRILDTRYGIGLTGAFASGQPRWIQVTGKAGVPTGAVAVTGNLTVTKQTTAGYIALGPVYTATPSSSTLNFPAGDNRANNVTVALSKDGRLSGVFIPAGGVTASTQLIFDVTGYFAADTTGSTFKALPPARVLDSRSLLGVTGSFANRIGRSFQVAGKGGVPTNAVAVTGNLTVTGQTSQGYAYVGPSLPSDMSKLSTSTVNVPLKDVRANGVTVPLGTGGKLSAVWAGVSSSKADLVFDVTGYFVADATGAKFVPLEPVRLLDTRLNIGRSGAVAARSPFSLRVGGRGGIPAGAIGVSGNVTVVNQTRAGFVTVSQHLTATTSTTSTLNFPTGDIRANGFAVSLYSDGTIGLLYSTSTVPATTNLVLDATGYFAR